MVSGPFLLPFHTQPIASFRGEWWAAVLGLAAAVTGLADSRRPLQLPALLFIPGILLAILLLQFALGRLVFPQLGLLYAAYLLWAGLLLALGRRFADTIGLARLADVLAVAMTLGALIGAAVALLQWLGLADRVPWAFPRLGGGIEANLGQANHHAHYSWLGIASAFYLRGRAYLSRGSFWLLLLAIGFGSILSGSRSVFAYALVLLAVLAWARHREPRGPPALLIGDAIILLPALVVLSFLGAWASPRIPDFLAWLGSLAPMLDLGDASRRAGDSAMSGARLYDSVSGYSARLAIAGAAWAAFLQEPWLGQGAGNYAWASFVAASSQSGDGSVMVAENAHNVILNLMTEFGAPATGIVILLLGSWARRFLRRPWGLEQFWCAAVLGIGLVHALLEYPLWYSYFLGPAALLLGATDCGKAVSVAGRRATIYLILAAVAGGLILGNLRSDYIKIEEASRFPLAAHPDRDRAWRMSIDRLRTLHRESLLSPWVLVMFIRMAEPSRQQAQDRAGLCERGIRFVPARFLLTRCAMQMAIAGRDQEARQLALAVWRAFPEQRTDTADELTKGAKIHPEIESLRMIGAGN